MALSISLMFGRLGGVAGSNAAALLLDNYCEATFYISGASLLGKCIQYLMETQYYFEHYFHFIFDSDWRISILHSEYS